MKILCFSDLHRDREAAARLVQVANDPEQAIDMVIGAGDFANRRVGAADTLDLLAAIELPAILVPGNGESADELRQAAACWRSAEVLHGNGAQHLDVPIYGLGGGIPVTPFGDWSYDFDEETAETMLADCPPHGILVVHSPPIDTVDHDSAGKIRGSQAIRDCVLAKKPKLVVCGHIHSDWGKQVTLGESVIVNAGPAGVIVSIET
ncbi:metallophosphoesterase [Rubripirellula amarantea]|uniref:Calcineurin-like phosphoesterase superfamily domain protein n=1 Tax=Rubripirellula amarantea TaxID=2527999 RepID=A0A5C5WPC0_9BACT|nr:metallophosphoesterase [Rubripirellula amarantea]MDA8743634.1 metallophosphoesterase [Rubripirellula amarantea]TWT52417.1 Calcineurin-like phosphoesterase superfamily domain protein [Rubripirellula amarantea]